MRFWFLALTWLSMLLCGFWVFGILFQVLLFEFPMVIFVERIVPLWPVFLK